MGKGVRLESNGKYWTAAWTTDEGQRRRKALGPKESLSRRAALSKCHDLAASMAIQPDQRNANRSPSLGDWCTQFMVLRLDLAKPTRILYGFTITYLKEFFGDSCRLDRISRAGADNWQSWLRASGTVTFSGVKYQGKDLAEPTACMHVRNAKVIMKRAINRGLLGANPFANLSGTPKRIAPNFAAITVGDLDRILDQCPDQRWRCMFALARLAGLRRGEAWRLEWGDVDWTLRVLRILPEADEDGRRVEGTKQRAREVPIQPKLYDILREAFEQADEGSLGPCRCFNPDTFNNKARQIVRSAGVGVYPKPMHTLRKNLESEWMSQHPTMTVCKWLGHSPNVAAEHYQRPTGEDVARVTKGKSVEDELRERIRELEAQIATAKPHAFDKR